MTKHNMTTWDGKAISPESPHGAMVVVYRYNAEQVEFLILQRAQATETEGDWAWTPPSGARYPGESIDDCARRELWEETGLELPLQRIDHSTATWAIYCAEAEHDAVIHLDVEHSRYEWVGAAVAVEKCLPDFVGAQIAQVARKFT